jgi:hypothetical protein
MIDLPSALCVCRFTLILDGAETKYGQGAPASKMKPPITIPTASPVAIFFDGMFIATVVRGGRGLPSGSCTIRKSISVIARFAPLAAGLIFEVRRAQTARSLDASRRGRRSVSRGAPAEPPDELGAHGLHVGMDALE